MQRLKVIFTVVITFGLTACEDEKTINVGLNEAFELEYGQKARIDTQPESTLEITEVEDSRCPADLICVWEGRVEVSLSLNYGDENEIVVLRENSEQWSSHYFGANSEYELELLKVEPAPATSDSPHALEDYSVTLIVNSDSDICTQEYNPQCGLLLVTCITTPCQPIYKTYGNTCLLENSNAELAFAGECGDLEGQPVPIPPEEPQACIEIYDPVCGIVGAEIKAYSNSCFAAQAGAMIIPDQVCADLGIEF